MSRGIDRATEGKSFFLLITFILALDCTLLHVYNIGLFQINEIKDTDKSRLVVDAVIFFAVFSGFMSFIMPIIAAFAYDLLLYFQIRISSRVKGWLFPELPSISPPEPGFVRLYQIKKKAYTTMDSFYIAAWKDAEEKFTEKRNSEQSCSQVPLCCYLCSIFSFKPPLKVIAHPRCGVITPTA